MRRRSIIAVLSAVAAATAAVMLPGGSPSAAERAASPAAPYLFLGWGDPPSASSVMSSTGIRSFTMAFVLSGGGCSPAWDSTRPLKGGVDEQVINEIRGAGGDIVPSFGGWQGNKLGPNCSSPEELAGAYQQGIDAYGLSAIDIDIENHDEFENESVQDRILNALTSVTQNTPASGPLRPAHTWTFTRSCRSTSAAGPSRPTRRTPRPA